MLSYIIIVYYAITCLHIACYYCLHIYVIYTYLLPCLPPCLPAPAPCRVPLFRFVPFFCRSVLFLFPFLLFPSPSFLLLRPLPSSPLLLLSEFCFYKVAVSAMLPAVTVTAHWLLWTEVECLSSTSHYTMSYIAVACHMPFLRYNIKVQGYSYYCLLSLIVTITIKPVACLAAAAATATSHVTPLAAWLSPGTVSHSPSLHQPQPSCCPACRRPPGRSRPIPYRRRRHRRHGKATMSPPPPPRLSPGGRPSSSPSSFHLPPSFPLVLPHCWPAGATIFHHASRRLAACHAVTFSCPAVACLPACHTVKSVTECHVTIASQAACQATMSPASIEQEAGSLPLPVVTLSLPLPASRPHRLPHHHSTASLLLLPAGLLPQPQCLPHCQLFTAATGSLPKLLLLLLSPPFLPSPSFLLLLFLFPSLSSSSVPPPFPFPFPLHVEWMVIGC